MSVYHIHSWDLRRSEENVIYQKTRVISNCEPTCRLWEFNPDTLREQPVLLTTEQSLQSLEFLDVIFFFELVVCNVVLRFSHICIVNNA